MTKIKKKRITQKDFKLLLTFLTDKNEGTLKLVKGQLKGILQLHPNYKGLIQHGLKPEVKKEAESFFEELRFQDLEPEFRRLFSKGENLDLERGLHLLALIQYPELKYKSIAAQFDKMALDVDKLIAKEKRLPTKEVYAMRKYIFEKKKFTGNEKSYYDPDNLFINKVLERKTGMPITLSCVYLFIAWRLKFPVHGVGLPGHFVVGHRVPRGVMHIDPFNSGRVLRVKDCEVLVRRLGMQFRDEYLDPMPNLPILSRLIVNMINVYNDMGNTTRAQHLAQLFQLF